MAFSALAFSALAFSALAFSALAFSAFAFSALAESAGCASCAGIASVRIWLVGVTVTPEPSSGRAFRAGVLRASGSSGMRSSRLSESTGAGLTALTLRDDFRPSALLLSDLTALTLREDLRPKALLLSDLTALTRPDARRLLAVFERLSWLFRSGFLTSSSESSDSSSSVRIDDSPSKSSASRASTIGRLAALVGARSSTADLRLFCSASRALRRAAAASSGMSSSSLSSSPAFAT